MTNGVLLAILTLLYHLSPKQFSHIYLKEEMYITNEMIPHITTKLFAKMSEIEKNHHYNMVQMKNAFRIIRNEKLVQKHSI